MSLTTISPMLTVPTVHVNGTSRVELQRQLQGTIDAVEGAIHALENCAPNVSDYDSQGPDAWSRANNEHYARLRRLVSVIAELEMMAIAVYDL